MADRKAQRQRRAELEKLLKQHKASLAKVGGVGQVKKSTEYNNWLKKNTGTKLMPDGSRQTVWKTGEGKGKPFNEKLGQEQFKQDQFGTATPYQDLQYLQQLDKNEARLQGRRANKLRIKTSQEDFEGKNIHLLQTDQLEAKLNKEAEELRKRTSFADTTEDETPPAEKLTIGESKESDQFKRGMEEYQATGQFLGGGNTTPEGQGGQGGRELGDTTPRGGGQPNFESFAGGENPFNDPAYRTNNTSSRERLTARERMRAQNVETFGGGEAGEWHVSKVQERHEAWKEARKGGKEAMAEFRKPENYGENLGSYLRNEKLKIKPKKKKVPVNKGA